MKCDHCANMTETGCTVGQTTGGTCFQYSPIGTMPDADVYVPKHITDIRKLPTYPQWKVVDWYACDRCDDGLVVELQGKPLLQRMYVRRCFKCGWEERGEIYHNREASE